MIMNAFHQRNRYHVEGGFSLLELLTALTITSMIVVMLFAAFGQASRAWTAAENRVDTFQTGRAILDLMTRAELQLHLLHEPDRLRHHNVQHRIVR
jgi:prepilin-type N-terminal cleavage/methylation domain-containing protein